MASRTSFANPSAPLRKSIGLAPEPHPLDRSPVRLQHLNDSRDHVGVCAAAGPDGNVLNLNLNEPASGLGLHRSALRFLQRAGAATTVSTTAGTNCGASAVDIEGLRACRRHVNTCCGISPCGRATSETTAPGKSASSTIRPLSSSENRRRRPVPVITSSRRTVTPGSSIGSSIGSSVAARRSLLEIVTLIHPRR